MSDWEIVQQEASIVVVGNFNPKIFHPEWFISKGIVPKWEYEQNEIVCVPDYANIDLPDGVNLQVFLGKLILRTNAQTGFRTLSDFIVNTFTNLSETPVAQIGMNFTSHIRILGKESWKKLGEKIVPQQPWIDASEFVDGLNEEERFKFGLWEIIMNLPRPDDLDGYIRAKLNVSNNVNGVVEFALNNHVEIDGLSVENLNSVLTNEWENALDFAQGYTLRVMNKYLQD